MTLKMKPAKTFLERVGVFAPDCFLSRNDLGRVFDLIASMIISVSVSDRRAWTNGTASHVKDGTLQGVLDNLPIVVLGF